MIAIIDYDIGNVGAVANMLGRIGYVSEVTSDPDKVANARKIILPGNGAYDACIRNLRDTGLIPVLEQAVLGDGVPLLGICVGAQMLGRGSEEGSEAGLGFIPMQVRRFPVFDRLPVPHMGWTNVVSNGEHELTADLPHEPRFYFTHSYYMQPDDQDLVLLTAKYGIEFAAGVTQGNITGVQFHPEKSHRYGKALLQAFAGERQ